MTSFRVEIKILLPTWRGGGVYSYIQQIFYMKKVYAIIIGKSGIAQKNERNYDSEQTNYINFLVEPIRTSKI
jgi:hypothetical protein